MYTIYVFYAFHYKLSSVHTRCLKVLLIHNMTEKKKPKSFSAQ